MFNLLHIKELLKKQGHGFIHGTVNVDLETNGFLTRHYINSGVDLTNLPFNFDFNKISECKNSNAESQSKLVCYVYEKKNKRK